MAHRFSERPAQGTTEMTFVGRGLRASAVQTATLSALWLGSRVTDTIMEIKFGMRLGTFRSEQFWVYARKTRERIAATDRHDETSASGLDSMHLSIEQHR